MLIEMMLVIETMMMMMMTHVLRVEIEQKLGVVIAIVVAHLMRARVMVAGSGVAYYFGAELVRMHVCCLLFSFFGYYYYYHFYSVWLEEETKKSDRSDSRVIGKPSVV